MISINAILLLCAAGVSISGPPGYEPPGKIPVRFAPEVVHSDHCSAVVSPDGEEIFWAQHVKGESGRKIFFMQFQDGSWSAPSIVPFTSREDGDCPVLSPDGMTMIFTSSRPMGEDNTTRRERLWLVSRRSSGWSEPRPVDDVINGSHLHWQASMDRDRNIYFASSRKGSIGRDDIFVSLKTKEGYATPAGFPPPINTAGHESTPFIGPGGDYLLFTRSYFGAGSPPFPTGLLVSFRQEDGSWSEPGAVPLSGVPLEDVVCPTVSPDQRYLFFLVLNKNEKSVYWVDASVVWDQKSSKVKDPVTRKKQ